MIVTVYEKDGVMLKKCPGCGLVKLTSEYYKRPVVYGHPYGIYPRCKECTKIFARKYRKGKVYKSIQHRYYMKHRDRLREEMKVRRSDPAYKDRRNQLCREKMVSNLGLKLRVGMRRRILCALKKGVKSKRTMELIGCSTEHLIKHIESQFTGGMSWDKIGHGDKQISIDHIIPCELFDLTQPVHQLACFNFKNTQPMWLDENMAKNDRLPDGRRASSLTKEEKHQALVALGYGHLPKEL